MRAISSVTWSGVRRALRACSGVEAVCGVAVVGGIVNCGFKFYFFMTSSYSTLRDSNRLWCGGMLNNISAFVMRGVVCSN
jgi:hypothetical protein